MIDRTRIVCAYVMKHDTGVAPNPFHGACSLAICTPNHKKSLSLPGDWIIGVAGRGIRTELGAENDWRIIYAMKIAERLDLDAYYNDPRFSAKIPRPRGSAIESCGDNFYCKNDEGHLCHTAQTDEHQSVVPGEGIEKQDIDGNRVFLSDYFWYFGKNASILPIAERWAQSLIAKFINCAVGLRNIYNDGAASSGRWSDADLEAFLGWLPQERGMLGWPTHWPAECVQRKVRHCGSYGPQETNENETSWSKTSKRRCRN